MSTDPSHQHGTRAERDTWTHLPQQLVLAVVRDNVSADDRGAPTEREDILGDHFVAPLHLHYIGNLDHRVLVGLCQVTGDDHTAGKEKGVVGNTGAGLSTIPIANISLKL